MSRAPSSRSRPSLSLSPVLLARADLYRDRHPGAHPSLSALVDAAILAYLDEHAPDVAVIDLGDENTDLLVHVTGPGASKMTKEDLAVRFASAMAARRPPGDL